MLRTVEISAWTSAIAPFNTGKNGDSVQAMPSTLVPPVLSVIDPSTDPFLLCGCYVGVWVLDDIGGL